MMVIHMGPGHRYNHGHLKLHGSLCCDLVMTGASEDHQHPRSSVDHGHQILNQLHQRCQRSHKFHSSLCCDLDLQPCQHSNNQHHQNLFQLQQSWGRQTPTE